MVVTVELKAGVVEEVATIVVHLFVLLEDQHLTFVVLVCFIVLRTVIDQWQQEAKVKVMVLFGQVGYS